MKYRPFLSKLENLTDCILLHRKSDIRLFGWLAFLLKLNIINTENSCMRFKENIPSPMLKKTYSISVTQLRSIRSLGLNRLLAFIWSSRWRDYLLRSNLQTALGSMLKIEFHPDAFFILTPSFGPKSIWISSNTWLIAGM